MSESKKSTFDHQLLFIAICLVAFGLVMNFSNGNSVRSIQQLKAVSFGIAGFCFVYIVPLHLYQKYAYHFLFITLISLLLVFTPVGHEVVSQNHNQTFHRWIKVGVFQIGTVVRTDNPRYGMQKSFIDYSFKNNLPIAITS